jgi:hypothetical protein
VKTFFSIIGDLALGGKTVHHADIPRAMYTEMDLARLHSAHNRFE